MLQHTDGDYHYAPGTAPPAPHTFSSPPSTPLTPIPHSLQQHGGSGGSNSNSYPSATAVRPMEQLTTVNTIQRQQNTTAFYK